MTKLMLVDDEIEIRQGIRDLIDWQANGITICGEAGNGREAIALINEQNPEIILVDISMPVMNGLELIEHLSNKWPSIKTVVVSGYDDFNYAQRALKHGASDYLLKPCKPSDILSTVLKLVDNIKAERKRIDNFEKLKLQLRESLPLLKEKFLVRLIKEEVKYLGNIAEKADFLKLNISFNMGKVLLISIDNYSSLVLEVGNEDAELFKFAIKNITEEILGEHCKCEVFEVDDNIAAIISYNPCHSDLDLKALTRKIKSNINSYMNFTVTIGIGNTFIGASGMNTSFNEALQCLETRFFLGEDSIINFDNIKLSESEELPFPIEEEKQIITALKTGDADAVNCTLDKFFTEISKSNNFRQVITSCMALLFSIFHLCIERNVNINDVLNQETIFEEMRELDTVHKLKDRLSDILKVVLERFTKGRNSNKLVGMAVEFINRNFNKDISLEIIAQELHFSAGYVGMLFKQAMGISFIDYLHKVRIEKACELLKDYRLKTYEVSNMVGYFDEKYFSQIFKKITGMTCTQYREHL